MSAYVKDFEDALTPAARRRLERDPFMTVLIERCITSGWNVETLAEFVGTRIGWYQPANARELMLWRLHKAAGDDVEGTDGGN